MQIKRIINLIEEKNAKLVVLLCHHNADPDAVCSAYALSSLLKKLKPEIEVEIAAAQGPSRLSKHLLNYIPARLVDNPRIEEADILIILDTNTIQQLDDWVERIRNIKAPIIVIDHHAGHPETEKLATLVVADENASSTCEIVYRFYEEANVKPQREEALALFLGIAFDTRHFILANSTTLKIAAELVDAGVNVQEALSMLSLPMDLSERIARLKASQRAKLMKINDWIIALSHVSAFQASAARALVSLGADIAVVAGQVDDSVRVSLRCTKEFHEKTGIHLGKDVAKPLGEYLHGMGGGHSISAGVNGVGDVESALKKCIRILREKIKKADLEG
ncbi:DHH family phosphoesterase [Candidatus Bathyarchaeota archaeon]|nr:MAG: DHH family phosphoesterase [Candidatus Bathyarchaeota archaeon]